MTSQTHIDLSPLLSGLEQPLRLVSNPDERERLQAYIDAARPQVDRAAFDLLARAVASFNDASAYQRAILEYADGGLHLKIEEAQDSEVATSFGDGDPERVTIRLPKELKTLIDLAAARHGMSANNWYVHALSRAVARQFRHDRADGPAEGETAGPPDAREGRRGGRRRGAYRGRGGRRGGTGGDSAGQPD